MAQIGSHQPAGRLLGAESAVSDWTDDFSSPGVVSEQSPTAHAQGWGDAFDEIDVSQPPTRHKRSPESVPRLHMERLGGHGDTGATPPNPRDDPFATTSGNTVAFGKSPYAPFDSPGQAAFGSAKPAVDSPNPFLSPAPAVTRGNLEDASTKDDDYMPF